MGFYKIKFITKLLNSCLFQYSEPIRIVVDHVLEQQGGVVQRRVSRQEQQKRGT